LKLAHLKAVFILPDNNSYPLFTLEVQTIKLTYQKRCDCDQVNAELKNFLVYDNVNYPNTLDPQKQYTSKDEIITQEILGVN